MSLATEYAAPRGYLIRRRSSKRPLTPAQRRNFMTQMTGRIRADSWPCDQMDDEINDAELACLAEIEATGCLTTGGGQTVETLYAQLGWHGSETYDGPFACTLDAVICPEIGSDEGRKQAEAANRRWADINGVKYDPMF